MSAYGLNQAGRAVIRGMVDAGESGEAVQLKIDHLSLSDSRKWDYSKNEQFCRELAARGYPNTAEHLARRISDT